MYLFAISSVPIDLVGDIDRFEEQLGGFFYGREFPMRLIASSTRFPMHAPIAAVRAQHHDIERLYLRTRRLRAAIDAWSPDDPTDLLVVALADLDPDLIIDLMVQIGPYGVDLPACRDGRATLAQWETFVATLDRLFWRVPWAREAVRMYETMEQRVLRAVQYTLLTWEPADVAEAAIRIPLAAVTRRPVTRIDALTPVISGPYREHLTYLEPDDPGQPVLAVLTSYDFTGEWNATLFHELISLNMDITIAVDVTTLNRTKSQRVAEMAYNAAKLVARDANLVDIRGEQVVHDARDVLAQLKGQTLHAIQVAILVRGRDKRELDANVICDHRARPLRPAPQADAPRRRAGRGAEDLLDPAAHPARGALEAAHPALQGGRLRRRHGRLPPPQRDPGHLRWHRPQRALPDLHQPLRA